MQNYIQNIQWYAEYEMSSYVLICTDTQPLLFRIILFMLRLKYGTLTKMSEMWSTIKAVMCENL